MAKRLEIRRHTDNDGDVLSDEGVAAALEIGRDLAGRYDLVVSSGAQRATQTAACFIAATGLRVSHGVLVEAGVRSDQEGRWKEAYEAAGSAELAQLREADPDLVAEDGARLAAGLQRILDRLPDGGRALVVGHSPTNEAAVFGLTGTIVGPLGKGEGVVVTADQEGYRVAPA